MKKTNKPKHFLVFKIIGFIAIIIAIVGIVLAAKGFNRNPNEGVDLFMLGGTFTCVGFFVGFICLAIGFEPEASKLGTKGEKYIQEQNKEVLTDISSTSAEINAKAVETTAKAIKKGLTSDSSKDSNDTEIIKKSEVSETNKKHCIYCGKKLPYEAKFCSKCGKEQK